MPGIVASRWACTPALCPQSSRAPGGTSARLRAGHGDEARNMAGCLAGAEWWWCGYSAGVVFTGRVLAGRFRVDGVRLRHELLGRSTLSRGPAANSETGLLGCS